MHNQFILQDKFLEQFFASEFGSRFYLTGGTALARFYFHHRESQDLDLFTNEQDQDFDFRLCFNLCHGKRSFHISLNYPGRFS